MRATVTPTEKPEKLLENLRPRVKSAERKGEKINVEVEEKKTLERVPGIKSFETDEGKFEGLGGKPVNQKAYAKINSKRDLAEAFLATVAGYDLVITECSREWDLKMLRLYNPSIKEVSEPSDIFEIEKSLNLEGFEDLGIEISDEDVDAVYRKVVS